VEADQILLGNGSMEVLSLVMTAFGGHTARGVAKVLFPEPSFPMYAVIAKTHGLTPLAVPLDERFGLDEEQCAQTITRERPVLSIFASPNNPTGNRFDEAALLRLARRVDGAFVVDEAYAEFSGQTLLPRLRDTPSLLISRSLSKIGLAGLRLGALVGARAIISELDRVRLPWNVNAVSLALGTALLDGHHRIDARIQAVVELRHAFDALLRDIAGVCVYPSEANFILVRVRSPAREVERRLIERGVFVKNVSCPGPLEGCLRITVGMAEENARCAQALRQALDR
jgi:histidinol-phosphate aminotransferase